MVERANLVQRELVELGASVAQRLDRKVTSLLVARQRQSMFTAERTFAAPVRTQFYGHGAFMGAAPALLEDERWARILAFLMPDVLEDIAEAFEGDATVSAIIPMLENNPVAAAFGVFHGFGSGLDRATESPHHLAGIEWDMFVDAKLLERWELAAGREPLISRIMEEAIDTCLIAHANPTDTVQEALGFSQYDDVRRTKKTAMGGLEIDAWLDFFGRALELALADDFEEKIAAMALEARSESLEACMLHTFVPSRPIERTIALYRAFTREPFLSIVIDIKSLHSTPRFLTDLIGALNAKGIHVAAVGSFLREEIDGVGAATQEVEGQRLAGPREVQFLHLAGDLQDACDAGCIIEGQSVLFNGASLLEACESAHAGRYRPRAGVVQAIERYRRRHAIDIGIYVQEGDCDRAAAEALARLTNDHAETFTLGFAWGGLRGSAHLAEEATPRFGYGSQKLLELVGKARHWQLESMARIAAPRP